MRMFFWTALFSFLFSSSFYAQSQNSNEIRIGLENGFKNLPSIEVQNNDIYIGYEKDGYFNSSAALNSSIGFSFKPISGTIYASSEKYSSYTAAFADKDSSAVPVLTGENEWRLYSSGERSGFAALKADNAVAVYASGKPIAAVCMAYNLQIQAKDDFIRLSKGSYRGRMEMYDTGSALTAVNVLDMEEYLYGVLAAEMPLEWSEEALKAQTVSGRTYAESRKGTHASAGYDLCNSSHCQAYNGCESESEVSISAVDATKGKMLYYNGKPINAVFHSSSGGYTADASEVWGIDAPYLKPVKDEYEKDGKEWKRTVSLAQIGAAAGVGTAKEISLTCSDISGRVNKLTINGISSSKTIEGEEIRSFFSSLGGALESRNFSIADSSSKAAVNNGNSTAKGVYIISNSGKRLYEAKPYVLTSAESVLLDTLEGLNAVGSSTVSKLNGEQTEAKSEYLLSSSSENITIVGKGWGHGVGMSQYGAKGMAESGFGYEQILKHYFTGVEIK